MISHGDINLDIFVGLYLNTETVNHFLEILKMLTETALRWLGDRGVHAHVVMVGEYFAMLGQWHEHHALDQFLQTGNYLDQVMQLSVASLSVMDPTTIQAVLDFLQVLLERIHDLGSLPHCQELYQATLKVGFFFLKLSSTRGMDKN